MNRSSLATEHIPDERLIEMSQDQKWLSAAESDHLEECSRCLDFTARILYRDFKMMKVSASR